MTTGAAIAATLELHHQQPGTAWEAVADTRKVIEQDLDDHQC